MLLRPLQLCSSNQVDQGVCLELQNVGEHLNFGDNEPVYLKAYNKSLMPKLEK